MPAGLKRKPEMRFNSLLFIVLTVAAGGCLSGDTSTGKSDTAPAKADSLQAVVFEQLAKAVESGAFGDSTQRFVKVCGKTLKAKGVKPPPGYDEAFAPWLKNRQPTSDECSAMAAKLRNLKTAN